MWIIKIFRLFKPRFFVYFSMIMFLGGLFSAYGALKLTYNSEQADAVIKTMVPKLGKGYGTRTVVFEFTDGRGRTHVTDSVGTYKEDISPGQTVRIIYDRSNPVRANFVDATLWYDVKMFFFGALWLLGSAALRYWMD